MSNIFVFSCKDIIMWQFCCFERTRDLKTLVNFLQFKLNCIGRYCFLNLYTCKIYHGWTKPSIVDAWLNVYHYLIEVLILQE